MFGSKSHAQKKNNGAIKKTLKKTAFMLDMKRRNKFITFFALFFIAAYFCMPSMETIVKKVVHKYGSEITGTSVNLKNFDIKLSTGEANVKKITVANPKGYKSKNLFSLEGISVKLNISSLTEDTIIIENILIDKPVVTYEMLSLTQNNVSDILQNIQQNTAKNQKDDTTAQEKDANTKESDKKVIIKNLIVQNGQVELMAGLNEAKQPIILPLPTIKLQNIGQEKKGASIEDALSTTIEKVLKTTMQTVTTSGLKDLTSQAADQLKAAGDSVTAVGKNQLENLKNLLK